MPLLEIKEILRHWLRGRAKKLIARRLGVDVKTVRKYVRAAEEYGLTREMRTAPTGHVVFAVATKMFDQQPGRPRGKGWKWCSRHRERVRNLLEQRATVSEIRSALGRLGVHVSASTLYRFVVSEFPHRPRAATDSSLDRPAGPPKVSAPPNQKRVTPQAERRDDEVQGGRMLGLLKRYEIQVLLRADHTQEEVAKLAGVAVSSVRRVAKEEPVQHVDDAAERARRRIGRPSVIKNVRKFVQVTLSTRPNLDAAEILHQACRGDYRGGDSAFYGLVAALRSKGGERVSRFEKLPTKDRRRKTGLESQRRLAVASERPLPEAREDSNSERTTAVPKQGCKNSYSLRLEYVKGTPLHGCAIAEKDLLSDWHRDFAILRSAHARAAEFRRPSDPSLGSRPPLRVSHRLRLYAHMGDDSLVVDMQEPGVSCDIPIKLVGLAQGDTFTYLFDFGDCHTFRLTVLAIEPLAAGQQLPRTARLPRERPDSVFSLPATESGENRSEQAAVCEPSGCAKKKRDRPVCPRR